MRRLGAAVSGSEAQASSDLTKITRHVYVVDDDNEVRESLSFVLATRDISVESFSSGVKFFEKLHSLAAAPIILDIRMPELDGIEFLHRLARHSIEWPVLVLSGHGEIGVAVQAIKLGAVDFMEKPVNPIELETGVEKAFKMIATDRALRDARLASRESFSLLTPREYEVLEGLCSGKANKQVAYALSISPRTVEMHRANALRRLGVRTLAQVVTMMNLSKGH